ncbi:chemotaxis protein CheW [Ectothiorhodospiraceae bacterium WFHF3C12]|nr:chemotaxis protein CheW [Ectothiorhodospiraceae bacterium WFHF3C12]
MAEAQEGYAEHVRSLLVPISEYNLLLPGTLLAEVVSYVEPSPLAGHSEDAPWILGMVSWRGQRVPLVALETLMFGHSNELGSRARIAVIKAVGNHRGMPYIGVLTQQIPRLITVHPDTIEPLDDSDVSGYAAIEAQVLVTGEPALIPDVEYLEQELYRRLYE